MDPSNAITSYLQKKGRTFAPGSRQFLSGLVARNIYLTSVADERKDWIKTKILSRLDEALDTDEQHYWEIDMAKCKLSDEAVFQRTVMMHLIGRYQLAASLDYTCESQWDCLRMPQRGGEAGLRMPMPKPDLAVAFRASALLDVCEQADLGDYRNIMCPEVFKEDTCDRAFHFLSIEAKGVSGETSNWKAHRQNHNTASQALHNIFFFMNMAQELEAFYETVRFYSVVATSSTFHVRVHRAVNVDSGRIRSDYPLAFKYDVVVNCGTDYTRATATRIIHNILVEYGLKTLLPLLERTVIKVREKLQAGPGGHDRGSELQEAQKAAEEERGRQRAESRLDRETTPAASRM